MSASATAVASVVPCPVSLCAPWPLGAPAPGPPAPPRCPRRDAEPPRRQLAMREGRAKECSGRQGEGKGGQGRVRVV